MIYFDNAATTPVDKDVLECYNKNVFRYFANPSSIHYLGIEAFNVIEKTKTDILKKLKLDPNLYQIIFTSSATESNNLAILGYSLRNHNRGNTIVTTKIEHASVLEVFKILEEKYKFNVRYLNVDENGKFIDEEINEYINDDTILVSLSRVNNELGLILDSQKIKKRVDEFPKCVLHLDLAQTIGKAELNFDFGDLATISSHKIHGLKSIACLIKKKKINLEPLLYGGGQEYGLRSSTMDTALILSFKLAIDKIIDNFSKNTLKVQYFFDFLKCELLKIDEIILHTYKNQSPYILNFSLKTKKASVVVEALSNLEIYVSSVSACSSKREEPSHVLLGLNKSLDEAKNSIRLSFSHLNTIDEARIFVTKLKEIIAKIRS
ncbi:MAG: cysteine desulfurase [Firmicutes bacterium]|uniref:Cysteine desulfurase n=1 Tax=Candidatus Onthovivens merdipullorum TaxID=2840889 RepID=A0A9D9DJD2_9BACL|nr:cysteine desulfurase [Candidatus Onthovivens merdipullorum]